MKCPGRCLDIHIKVNGRLDPSSLPEPDNINYLYALTEYYLKRERFQEAKSIARQMVARHPAMQVGRNLLRVINRKLDETN